MFFFHFFQNFFKKKCSSCVKIIISVFWSTISETLQTCHIRKFNFKTILNGVPKLISKKIKCGSVYFFFLRMNVVYHIQTVKAEPSCSVIQSIVTK